MSGPVSTAGPASRPAGRADADEEVFFGDGPGSAPTGGWLRRNRTLVLVAALVLLSLVVAVLTAPREPGEPLSPDNAGPEGARAVAQVLGRQGVQVRTEERLEAVLDAVAAEPAGSATVLLLDGQVLPPDELRRLRSSGAGLLLVQPTLPVLQVLAPELTLGGTSGSYTADPGCEDPDARVAGEARGGGSRYLPASGAGLPGVQGEEASSDASVEVCYARGSGTNPQAGSYAVVDDPAADRRVVVHGQPDVLTNEWLAEEGNSALALRSLGREETLIWYRVDPFDPVLDTDGPTPTATDLLPSWVRWVTLQLLVVGAVAVLWRYRRLGRLVPERLPAVVRSAETTEGRARLYRTAGARGTSAQVLRRATSRRLAARLATGSGADAATLARLAAAASGRDPVEVGLLLDGPEPPDDAALVRLADDLDRLEREVTHR